MSDGKKHLTIYQLHAGDYEVEGRFHTGYGILCKTETEELLFPDISTDVRKVRRLIKFCNMLQADPIHLPGIVEDTLLQPANESKKVF